MKPKKQLIDLITKTKPLFFSCVQECNSNYRFGNELNFYRKVIARHRESMNITLMLSEEEFIELIYATLKAWNMDQRNAELTAPDDLKRSIRSFKNELEQLYKYKLINISKDEMTAVVYLLQKIFCSLDVMASKRRIVGVSKTLHLLLPDLVMPMDSKFTMTYFYGYNKYSPCPVKEFEIFKRTFLKTKAIATSLALTAEAADGNNWNTTIPKLIDNATIGFNSYFETSIKKSGDDAPEKMMEFILGFGDIPKDDKALYIKLLAKLKAQSDATLRKKVEKKIIIKKAIEAGITVSDEEIEQELRRRGQYV